MNNPTHLKRQIASLIFIFFVILLARPSFAAPGEWAYSGLLNYARALHTATVLPDGRVLVAADEDFGEILKSAETYTPATGNWTLTGSLTFTRELHTATLLSDGRVLVTGGDFGPFPPQPPAELYNPTSVTDNSSDGSTDTFSITLGNGYSASGTLTSGDIQVQ